MLAWLHTRPPLSQLTNMLARMMNGTAHKEPKARPYQEDSVAQVIKEWDEGRLRVLLCQSTGSGKTTVAGLIIKREVVELGGKVLVVTDRKKLTRQFAHRTEADFGIPCGIEMASEGHEGEQCVVCTVQTITSRIKSGKFHPEEFTLLVFDEAHLALSASFQTVASHFSKAKVLGLTATPVSATQKDLLTFFDSKIEPITLKELIEQKYLAPIKVRNFPIQIKLEASSKNADFKDEDINHAIEPYLESCADELVSIGRDRCTIAFLPLIQTSKKFAAMLNARSYKTEHVDGEMDEKAVSDALGRLEMGTTRCLTCSMILAIGVDCKPVNLILSLRPTKSWTLFVQQCGRGTRTFDPAIDGPKGTLWPKKEDLLICDPLWLTDQHSLLQRPATLFAKDEEQAKAMDKKLKDGDGDLLEAFSGMMHEREEALKKRLDAMSRRSAREINAMDLATLLHDPELYEHQSLSRRELESMTQGQRDFLLKNKVDLSTIKDFGHASKVVEALIGRIKQGLCTLPQGKFAESLGLANPYARSFDDVSAFISAKKAGHDPFASIPDL